MSGLERALLGLIVVAASKAYAEGRAAPPLAGDMIRIRRYLEERG